MDAAYVVGYFSVGVLVGIATCLATSKSYTKDALRYRVLRKAHLLPRGPVVCMPVFDNHGTWTGEFTPILSGGQLDELVDQAEKELIQ